MADTASGNAAAAGAGTEAAASQRLGTTLVKRYEGAVIENGAAIVSVEAPAPPAGGAAQSWEYLAVVRIPAFDLTGQTPKRLLVEGTAVVGGLCPKCIRDKEQLRLDLERALTGLAEYQKLVAEFDSKIAEAEQRKQACEARTLPKIDTLWQAVEQLAQRSWNALGNIFNAVFMGGSFSEAQKDLAEAQKAKAKVDVLIGKIEDVRKNCPHFEPTITAAKGELERIRDILRSFRLTNLVDKGKELADAINAASNTRQLAQMLDGKPCQACVDAAQKAIDELTKKRDELKQKADEFSKQAQELQAKLDAFPTDCNHPKPAQGK